MAVVTGTKAQEGQLSRPPEVPLSPAHLRPALAPQVRGSWTARRGGGSRRWVRLPWRAALQEDGSWEGRGQPLSHLQEQGQRSQPLLCQLHQTRPGPPHPVSSSKASTGPGEEEGPVPNLGQYLRSPRHYQSSRAPGPQPTHQATHPRGSVIQMRSPYGRDHLPTVLTCTAQVRPPQGQPGVRGHEDRPQELSGTFLGYTAPSPATARP